MANDDHLLRLIPFEGMCLTADDLMAEQAYHRRALERHARFLSGHGVVQGLSVELTQRLDRYVARIRAGFGLTSRGQGAALPSDEEIVLEGQKADGDYLLWLVRRDAELPDSMRPVFDTTDGQRPSRIEERVVLELHPVEQHLEDGVALARIRLRLGRMVLLHTPVPRAGRVARAAESALKPRVLDFAERCRLVMDLLYRTRVLQELSISAYGFYAALVSAELLLIEEGTPDRVLYRTAGVLVRHARAFFDSDGVREMTDHIHNVADALRAVDDGVPEAHQDDREWQRWFELFERVLHHVQRAAEDLKATADPNKAR
jgi:hypothetical protein